MVAGKVSVPKLWCLKEVKVPDYPANVIPVALKPSYQAPIQKFKFPFKTCSSEIDVDFQFSKVSAALGGQKENYKE